MFSGVTKHWQIIILATALSGASALMYEVIASRVLGLFFGSALTSVTTVLITFLGGLALGGALMTIMRRKWQLGRDAFVIIQVFIALYAVWALTQFAGLPSVFDSLNNIFSSTILVQFVGGFLFVIVPTILLGATFPLATSLLTENNSDTSSKRIGWLYTWDVLGAVLGAGMAGFWLLPSYGTAAAIVFAAFLNILAGLIMLSSKKFIRLTWLVGTLVVMLGAGLMLGSSESYSVELTDDNTIRVHHFSEEDLLFETSSPYGVITVRKREQMDGQVDRILAIDDRDQCLALGNSSEKFIARGALSDLPSDREVLSIGLGCGFTLSAILDYDPASVTVAEINPLIPDVARTWFGELNGQATEDERVSIVVQDGAEFLRTWEDKYDTIIIDIENPTVAHSSSLYTVEYFAYAKEKLNPGGRLALWGYQSKDLRYLKSLIATFEAVFENVIFAEDGVLLFVASDDPLDVSYIDIHGTTAVLQAQINALEEVEPNTLDKPTLEAYYNT